MGTSKKLLLVSGLMLLLAGSSVFAELQLTPYGAASYRYRGKLWMASTDDSTAVTFDHFNQLLWQVGLKAKVDDQLSFQFQIGNDWYAGENVSWSANNTIGARTGYQNLYVHLAYAKWNPGYLYMDVGVIPMNNVSLDLLERSLSTGSYNEAVYLGWGAAANNSLMAARVGVPVLTEDVKLSAEMAVSVIDPRTQALTFPGDRGIDSASSLANPTSFLVLFSFPSAAGNLKFTPEVAAVVNRNYNRALETGDHEILGGASASYKFNDMVSVSLMGAYGMIDNTKSKAGRYGVAGGRSSEVDPGEIYSPYCSRGIQFGAGTTVKAGPGVFALDLKYGQSADVFSSMISTETRRVNLLIDPRYTWKVHPNFTISPRCRVFATSYSEDRVGGDVRSKTEYRPELTIGGSF